MVEAHGKPCTQMKTATLAYIAGLLDGEGTITLSRDKYFHKYRHPVVSVASNTKALLYFLRRTFGGGTIIRARTYKKNHAPSYGWQVSYNRALRVLEAVLPYMREPGKVRRARYILQRYKKVTLANGQYTPAQHRAKIRFEQQFFALPTARVYRVDKVLHASNGRQKNTRKRP